MREGFLEEVTTEPGKKSNSEVEGNTLSTENSSKKDLEVKNSLKSLKCSVWGAECTIRSLIF